MLGLATHAPAIVLLREKVVFRSPRADSPNKVSLEGTGEFTLLHVDLLRRYLDHSLPSRWLDDARHVPYVIGHEVRRCRLNTSG